MTTTSSRDITTSILFPSSPLPDVNTFTSRTIQTPKGPITPRTIRQGMMVNTMDENDLSFGTGPAGTGKTFVAVAWGAEHMMGNNEITKMILTRPVLEAGERLGFLPGDFNEKIDPYMQPLYDALNHTIPAKILTKLKENKQIEVCPLAYMRGRTFENAIVIADEMQNATTMQMKMLLTRMGQNTKMIITGDPQQVDLPKGTQSGLNEAKTVLKNTKGIGWTHFDVDDVVRHPLVKAILKAYAE